jgi:hypothetical protein
VSLFEDGIGIAADATISAAALVGHAAAEEAPPPRYPITYTDDLPRPHRSSPRAPARRQRRHRPAAARRAQRRRARPRRVARPHDEVDACTRPRTGVREGFGVALGIVVETASGTRVEWLHDPARWRPVAGYADERSLQPRVTYTRVDGGLTVTLDDAVLPSPDVLPRRVRYARTSDAAGAAIRSVALMAHTNLGLTQNVIPRLPFGDVLADSRNDFGVVDNSALGAFVHFRPTDRAPITDIPSLVGAPVLPADHSGPMDALLRRDGDLTADVDRLAAALDTTFTRGVYAVVGNEPRADAFHAGREGDDFCDELGRMVDDVIALRTSGITLPIDPGLASGFRCPDALRPSRVAAARGWTRSTPSAWSLASTNALAGNPVAAYLSDSAMRVPFTTTGMTGEARLLIAFGATATEARAAYGTARGLMPTEVIVRDGAEWTRRAGGLVVPEHLPETVPAADRERIVRAARRAMFGDRYFNRAYPWHEIARLYREPILRNSRCHGVVESSGCGRWRARWPNPTSHCRAVAPAQGARGPLRHPAVDGHAPPRRVRLRPVA